MIPNRSDLVGRWSENLGHEKDLSSDATIEFCDDGSLVIQGEGERVEGRWEMPAPGRLLFMGMGPFDVTVNKERLPLGVFEVLQSSGALLPFDRERFTRVPLL